MSCSRLVAATLVLGASGCAQAAPVSCPSYVADSGVTHALDDASVFDGAPAELADLEPTDHGWDLTSLRDSKRPIFLVCKYHASTATRTFKIARGTAACLISVHAGATEVTCK